MRVATRNPVLVGDVTVLLTVLGRFEGDLRGGVQDEDAVQTLGERCRLAGLLAADAPLTRETVTAVLESIGQRLRYALGEYEEDPTA
jgi:hypothetical protein